MTTLTGPPAGDSVVPGTYVSHAQVRRGLVLLPAVFLAIFTPLNLASLLSTPGRIDGHGLLKGHDFVQFYVLGTFALEGRGNDLHDADAMAREMQRLVPGSPADTFLVVHGPHVALFFAPFAALPYEWALAAWLTLIAAVYAWCARTMWRRLPGLRNHGAEAVVLLAASPALHGLLVSGQTSAIALAMVTACWLAFRSGRPVAAGMALGLLTYKPTLAVVLVAAFIAAAEWRVLAAAAAAAAAQMLAAAMWFGREAVTAYLGVLASTPGREELEFVLVSHKHSLRAFFTLLMPGHPAGTVLYLAVALLVVALTIRVWRRRAPFDVRFALALLATVLASPHLFIYDVIVLTPAFLLLWNAARERYARPERAELALYLAYLAPFAAPLAQVTGIQVSTLGFLGLFGAAWHLTRTSAACTPTVSRPIQETA